MERGKGRKTNDGVEEEVEEEEHLSGLLAGRTGGGVEGEVTARTVYSVGLESGGRERKRAMAAEREVVRSVVVSFAKRPLMAAARPLPTARWSQDMARQSEVVYMVILM
jgi:hypothetical protein